METFGWTWKLLCLQPQRVQAAATALAALLSDLEIDAVCGPLVEGALVALMVALQLDIQFTTRSGSFAPLGTAFFLQGIECRLRFGRAFAISA